MSLLIRIYFNAVFGALGGLLGWMLFGVFDDQAAADAGAVLRPPLVALFGDLLTADGRRLVQRILVGGTFIGGLIGYFVVSVEAIRDRSLVRFARLATYGVLLGALGGVVGMSIGEGVNDLIVQGIGPVSRGEGGKRILLGAGTVLARGLGWMFLGLAVGVSEGVAARSLGKLSYGTLGGALGGFLGGVIFGLFYLLRTQGPAPAEGLAAALATAWSALGLVILGACIGALSALVQGVMQPASVKVLRGWQEGREYPLLKADTVLGRDERADVALFRDMRVEKRHASIRRQGDRFLLVNHGTPPEQTRVNDEPVPESRDLQDGDRIQLGNILLRFQRRAAAVGKRQGDRVTR